jgi:hypothetical protein
MCVLKPVDRPPSYPELREEERRREAAIAYRLTLMEQLRREIEDMGGQVVIVRKEPPNH